MLIEYKVRYWDDFDETEKSERGLVAASDWNSVIARMEKYYGKDNLREFSFVILETLITEEELSKMWDE